MEELATRKVNPFLAFVAGLFVGMGYVYVGRLRAGVFAFAGFYGLIGLFSWSVSQLQFSLLRFFLLMWLRQSLTDNDEGRRDLQSAPLLIPRPA